MEKEWQRKQTWSATLKLKDSKDSFNDILWNDCSVKAYWKKIWSASEQARNRHLKP